MIKSRQLILTLFLVSTAAGLVLSCSSAVKPQEPETKQKFVKNIHQVIEMLEKNLEPAGKDSFRAISGAKQQEAPEKPDLQNKKQDFSQPQPSKKRVLQQKLILPAYSQDKSSVATLYENALAKEKYLVVNNRFFGPFSEIEFCGFSPSGNDYAFCFLLNQKWFLQFNEEISLIPEPWENIKCSHFKGF